MARGWPLLASIGCTALLVGCGIHDPYQRPKEARATAVTSSSTPTGSPDPNERDGPEPRATVRVDVPDLSSTAQAALERFARLYVNWTATALPKRARQLAAISIGQARAEAFQMATRSDTLARYQVINTGSVVAIAPGQGQEQGHWAVVTNELTSGLGPYVGLPATSHVTWATVTRETNGYVVSTWYPGS